jgi:RNA polymerase sigma-70 factor (ECF subfamily)
MLQHPSFRAEGRNTCPVHPSLAELGRRAAAGDRRALDDLLRTVETPVLRYLNRRLAQHPAGSDVAGDLRQEVLLRVSASLARCRFENDRRLYAWIISITHNVLVDYLRAERARYPTVPQNALELLADRAALAQWQSAFAEPAPTELLDQVTAAALAGLPPQTLELIRLRVHLERTWPDVAAALGTTPSAAKRRYQRAQATLRTRFLTAYGTLSPPQRHALRRAFGLESPHEEPTEL